MVEIHPEFTKGECDSVCPSLQSVWDIHALGEDLILDLCPAIIIGWAKGSFLLSPGVAHRRFPDSRGQLAAAALISGLFPGAIDCSCGAVQGGNSSWASAPEETVFSCCLCLYFIAEPP